MSYDADVIVIPNLIRDPSSQSLAVPVMKWMLNQVQHDAVDFGEKGGFE